MELIDRDVLHAKLVSWIPNQAQADNMNMSEEAIDYLVSLIQEVEEAPTVEPQGNRGEWVLNVEATRKAAKGTNTWACSLCSFELDTHGKPYGAGVSFCPNCGAQMT